VSRHRAPGRRRAPGRVRRLPDGFPRLGASLVAKSVAGLSVLGGAVAFALPVDTAGATAATALALPAAASAETAAFARLGDDGRASRSAARAASPAVAAPEGLAPVRPADVGVSGVKAVAAPKAQTADGASAGATGGSWSGALNSRCTGIGLQPSAERLCSAVYASFTPKTIGGYRPNAGEHSTGRAVDIMITNKAQGDAVAAWVQQHVGQFRVQYVIWRQRYWEPGAAWDPMEDRGSPTANHMDHVHVTLLP